MSNGTNYTLYYNVLNYLKSIMQNHPSIRYVTQGDVFSIDTFPFPQYPLGNVIITNATFDGKSTDYGVQIVVADKIKLKDNESSGSNNQQTIEFEGVDDTVDIHANTLSILNDLLSYTDRKEEGFEIQGTTSCTAFKQEYDNGLAGWSADFTLRVHNDRNICLFELNPPPPPPTEMITNGLVSYFDTKIQANDSQWLDQIGTYTGSIENNTFVTTNTGEDFLYYNAETYVNEEMDFGNNNYLTGTTPRTVLLWTRAHFPTSGEFPDRNLYSMMGIRGATGNMVFLEHQSGSNGLTLDFQNTSMFSNLEPNTDEWTMVGYRFEGTTTDNFDIIMNNQIYSGSAATTATIDTQANYQVLGGAKSDIAIDFTGSFATYIQYDRKLTDGEIGQMYNWHLERF